MRPASLDYPAPWGLSYNVNEKSVAIKVNIPRTSESGRPLLGYAIAAVVVIGLVGSMIFAYYYNKFGDEIDRRRNGQFFSQAATVYARPINVHSGDRFTLAQIASSLHHAGYTEGEASSGVGSYELGSGSISIKPGPTSYHSSDGARIYDYGDRVDRITSSSGAPLDSYELEPEVLTALFSGQDRTKRQILQYDDLPDVMVQAVCAAEDRKFFEHGGVNWFSVFGSAIKDVLHMGRRRGASTITMQVARSFFLSPEQTYSRKMKEMIIAIELENKLTKKEIFALYANQEYMGQRGSFSINGFGEASRAYFGKDIKEISLPEAAMLAGLIQSPNNLWNPYKHPDRATERRNIVLDGMVETGAISQDQCDRAKATPLKVAPPNVEASEAPYFVDLVKDELSSKYSDTDLNGNGYRIYTTLDPELQSAAAEAVAEGIQQVDQLAASKHGGAGHTPQVAMVALDPHTGEVLALVGGRNYGFSQLDHALAKRPTGSIFKPFVYAAAMNSALGGGQTYTQVSMLDDSRGGFEYDGKTYDPRNYKSEYHGTVTARYALQMSLNNATVRMAEMVGYDRVAQLARSAGIASVQPTPSAALGAYAASPLEMAGAYTVLANGGTRMSPLAIRSIRQGNGDVVEDFHSASAQVLDPRVAYVMTNMMQNVMDHGTGATVRARGFTAPAAGKTGTSHDGWFAGYTRNLLCIVWVGYDDYSDLKLSGSQAAAPIWAAFMKRAVTLPQYSNVGNFDVPAGVAMVALDRSNLIATDTCPAAYTVAFVDGTQPTQSCDGSMPQAPGTDTTSPDDLTADESPVVSGTAVGDGTTPPDGTTPDIAPPRRVHHLRRAAPRPQPLPPPTPTTPTRRPPAQTNRSLWDRLSGFFSGNDKKR